MDLRSRIEASYKRIAKEAYDKGYADSIKDIMDLRFGGMPDESLAALREIKDVAVMRSIQNAALSWDRDEVLTLIAQSRPA
ncbi:MULTISPECIES: hypothetical protein [unclassified Anaerobiospirillum]|uniref:hypothetical protein n=1 Tax=unclassified Anaerobiospirillum TaxID=2647410 RepID=UPI001FF41346|nr:MULTISPECIES: hypothetical protein [unclassified Anaerobiospirillum]MCK0534702.1 hypothetical protein [Anaerobiospirillum sp. NML120511]MCK0539966.1 hypothetical protein [Anaerobiospirillum sp. NML02-A-032]